MSVAPKFYFNVSAPDQFDRRTVVGFGDGDERHRHFFNINNATEREKFAKQLIANMPGSSRVAGPEDWKTWNGEDVPEEWVELSNRILLAAEESDLEAANTTGTTQRTTAVVIDASTVTPKPINWLWPGRMALGKLSILAGDPGGGKSTVTCDMAARVSTGTCWPDNVFAEAPRGTVIMLNCEDDIEDTIVPRLNKHAADLTKIKFIPCVTDALNGNRERQLNLADDMRAIETVVEQVGDCKLIVIDPITAHMGDVDSNCNADVRGILAPWSAFAAKHGIALLGISHLNKGNGAAMYRTMGSLAFVAAARSAWCVTKDKADQERRLFLPIKNNIGPDVHGLSFRLVNGMVEWEDGTVSTTADEALGQTHGMGPDAEDRNDAVAFLAEALANGPRLSSEVEAEGRDGYGLTKRTLTRARKELGVEAYRPNNPGPWYLRLIGGRDE